MSRYLWGVALPEGLHPQWFDVNRYAELPALTNALAKVLEEITCRTDIWGYSAVFEFIHEVSQRGLALPFSDHHRAMAKILEDCGFDVLCERWYDFTEPRALHLIRTQNQRLASEMAPKLLVKPS